MSSPSARHTATTAERTIFPGPSGQVLAGFSTDAPSISPGCCTATSTRRSCTIGPQVSAPVGNPGERGPSAQT